MGTSALQWGPVYYNGKQHSYLIRNRHICARNQQIFFNESQYNPFKETQCNFLWEKQFRGPKF